MAPATVSARTVDLNELNNELPKPKEHELTAPSCSPLIQETAAVVFQSPGNPKQASFDGEIWPPVFNPDSVRKAKALKLRDSDVFVCTYPKCGTTWIQHICSQLLAGENGTKIERGKELYFTSPMIERMGGDFADKLESPRLLKTHFTYKNVPKGNDKVKYIYAVRNPKDCLTSYFFHNRNFKIYDFEHGEFPAFFELFMSKDIAFGNYFDHLLSWLPHINDQNVLFLKYEDMCDDLKGSVERIGTFLGGKAAERVKNQSVLDEIVENSTLKSMKKDQWRWFPESNLHQSTFIRKGGSGDWKNYFSREQSERLDELYKKILKGTISENWWQEEMAWDELEEDIGLGDEISDSINESSESVSTSSSRPSSRRGSVEVDLTQIPDLRLTLQKLLRERLSSSCASSGYGSLSSSLN